MSDSVYVDTSALGRILTEHGAPTTAWLDAFDGELVSSDLLETELRRIAVRDGIAQEVVTELLEGVSLASLDRAVYRSAGMLPMRHLRTLDALHLEAAVRLDVDAILTYDVRLRSAATEIGIAVVAPD